MTTRTPCVEPPCERAATLTSCSLATRAPNIPGVTLHLWHYTALVTLHCTCDRSGSSMRSFLKNWTQLQQNKIYYIHNYTHCVSSSNIIPQHWNRRITSNYIESLILTCDFNRVFRRFHHAKIAPRNSIRSRWDEPLGTPRASKAWPFAMPHCGCHIFRFHISPRETNMNQHSLRLNRW